MIKEMTMRAALRMEIAVAEEILNFNLSVALHFRLAEQEFLRQDAAMESHEWKDRDEEGQRRFYRANYQGGRWRILTTTMKRDPVWDIVENPSTEIWEAVRDVVWKKYQRKRLPWDRVAEIDRMLGVEPDPHGKK